MIEYIKKSDAIEAFNGADLYRYCDPDATAREIINDLPAAEVVSREDYHNLLMATNDIDRALREYQAKAAQGEWVPVRKVKLKKIKADEIPDEWKLPGDDKPTRKKIYIAGPVTGVPDYLDNFQRAERALRAKGYEPVSPVADGLVDGWTYRDYINRGFRLLMDCDGILLLPGFMESKGAALELHYALAVGMEVVKCKD